MADMERGRTSRCTFQTSRWCGYCTRGTGLCGCAGGTALTQKLGSEVRNRLAATPRKCALHRRPRRRGSMRQTRCRRLSRLCRPQESRTREPRIKAGVLAVVANSQDLGGHMSRTRVVCWLSCHRFFTSKANKRGGFNAVSVGALILWAFVLQRIELPEADTRRTRGAACRHYNARLYLV